MHKMPHEIARSLRAFNKAYRLGLLRHVRIEPGSSACEAARSQTGIAYIGNAVPRLPLPQCTEALCACDYVPVGTDKLQPTSAKRAAKKSRDAAT
jgi:hypothetical protein